MTLTKLCGAVTALLLAALTGVAQEAKQETPGESGWLDGTPKNWNATRRPAAVPKAPVVEGSGATLDESCRASTRPAESAADRQLARAGWILYAPVQSYGGTQIIKAMSGTDGMCRPTGYQIFVFVNNRLAGTLSPVEMDSRTNGAEVETRLVNASTITSKFVRYAERDPLCCPSRTSEVEYRVERGAAAATVVPLRVNTTGTDSDGLSKSPTASVSGNVFYLERIALPPNASVNVKLVDVSKADAPAKTIGEQTIENAGRQVPIPFEISYDTTAIDARHTYAVQARITVDGKLWFISTTSYMVITRGHPNRVEVRVNRATQR